MSYGRWLDRALASLEAAAGLSRADRAASHPDAVAVLDARRTLYMDLERLQRLVAAPDDFSTAAPATARDLRALLVATLTSPEDTVRLLRTMSSLAAQVSHSAHPVARAGDGVAAQLSAAGLALRAAGDVLASHINPGGPPRSPVGEALRDGAGRNGALGDLAAVASALCHSDQQIRAWLQRGMRRHPHLRTMHGDEVRAMRTLADPALEAQLTSIAAFAPPSGLRRLEVADSASTPPQKISTLEDVTDVVKAVAVGLYRDLDNASILGVSDACKLGLRVAEAREGPGAAVSELWRKAAVLADGLGPQPKISYALRTSISDAVQYLSSPRSAKPGRARQPHAALAGALADLAAAIRQTLERELVRNRLLAPTTVLSPRSTGLLHLTEKHWTVLSSADDSVNSFVDLLTQLAEVSTGVGGDDSRLSGTPAAIASQLEGVGPAVSAMRSPATRTTPSSNQPAPVRHR